MDQEFVTIGEAARLLRQTDGAIMRLIKEALLAGIEKEKITKAEMREGRMMYLVSKIFLIEESTKTKPSFIREKEILFKEQEGEVEQEESQTEKAAPEESESSTNGEFRSESFRQKEESFSEVVLSAKNDMIATLQKVVDTKDQQIENLSGKIDQLIERDHESNILLKGLQDRLFLLEEGHSQNLNKQEKKKRK